MAASFATSSDYIARGLDPTPWGDALDMKLADASRIVRAAAPDIDAHIEDGTIDEETVTYIVCEMVRRAAPLTDLGIPAGVESAQIGVDVFQQSLRFGPQMGGGAGALYISTQERGWLKIGVQRAFTVRLGGHHENP